ncbi:MATE efflux family protein [Mycoplasmopsis californica]|uniref:MATE family efflux transporter n=1 Tax=Mycoplasmopsis equigenitalium TaxID=114883 RepID=A0ABY5J4E0_9BACT|nr:MATE family efflux transporter [Mycoplasmopsis equigenitalium]UUD36756.1 MATE family efflux transporter [Mycoplasmopsis equigenitalium]VEU69949.1 MATE efflux family protein [Mycoplasmopsis californica]
MNNSKQERAFELFAKTKVSKVIWIVGIPALLGSVMVGLYTFIDQLLIQQFTPSTKPMFGESGLLYDYVDGFARLSADQMQALIDKYNANISDITKFAKLTPITPNSVVSTSIVSFNPIIIFINATVFLVPVGSSVYYTKLIAKNREQLGKDVWGTVFWASLVMGLISGGITITASFAGLPGVIAGKNSYDSIAAAKMGADFDVMKAYFDAAHSISVKWAKFYILVYGGGTFIMALHVLLSFLIRAEGKNNYVLIIAIISNLCNIGLDALFIIVFKLGVLGGALATLIGWIVNLLGYLWYCYYNTKKQHTWLDLKYLFRFKFKKQMLLPVSFLGLSGFLRSFTIAFSVFIITFLFSHTEFSDAVNFQYYWSKANPVFVLFMFGIFGITDGARPLMSYNYANRNFKRCKETAWWALISAAIVAAISIIAINIAAPLFAKMLNVEANKWDGSVLFLRLLATRLFFFAPIIVALIIFQGTNNVLMSSIVAAFEGFICFIIIMPLAYLTGLMLYRNGNGTWVANVMIIVGWIVNSIISGITIGTISFWYLYKKIPHIDQNKLTFSRRLEHKLIQEAELYEKMEAEKLAINEQKVE